MTNFIGVADVGVLHGDEDGPGSQAPGSGSKIHTHHVGQHEKLKRLDVKKSTKGPNWPWWKVDSSAFLFRLQWREILVLLECSKLSNGAIARLLNRRFVKSWCKQTGPAPN